MMSEDVGEDTGLYVITEFVCVCVWGGSVCVMGDETLALWGIAAWRLRGTDGGGQRTGGWRGRTAEGGGLGVGGGGTAKGGGLRAGGDGRRRIANRGLEGPGPLTVVDSQRAVAHLACSGDLDPLSLFDLFGAAQDGGAGAGVVPAASRQTPGLRPRPSPPHS